MDLKSNLQAVTERIEKAAVKSGRNPGDIRLVAATKQVEPERILDAVRAGVRTFGENYAQELRDKYEAVERGTDERIEWHFIGRLQRNKVKYLIDRVKLIHSLDSIPVAEEINKRAVNAGIRMPVLIEVNSGGEAEKGGVNRDDVGEFLDRVTEFSSVDVVGLMTMPPYFDDPRPYFTGLRELRDGLSARFPALRELSMGMSGDYEAAIEEGATMVRIGSAIFGPRL